ncbi:MAG: glycosyltransferase family 4 protein [Deltaproteobacteria bacterium]|nr:glycosyltransferase family 4 protein [Deltaproteobacteria bacterium]
MEVLSARFLSAMRERGYEFIVVTAENHPGPSHRECDHGIPIYRLPFGAGLSDHNLKEVKETIRRVIEIKRTFNPDIVHLNSIDVSVFFHLLTDTAYPAPSLFTVHSLPPNQSGTHTLMKKMLSSAAWVTTTSEAMLRAVRNLASEVTARSSLIYNGLPQPDVQPSPLPFAGPRLLCIGRIVRDKGFDLAMDAFGVVIDRFPAARLIIAGDGPAMADLDQRAARYRLSGAVEFIGWAPPEEVPELINTATAVIIPSRWEEPFGLVALEAAQMGRPVVAARVGGLAEIVEHQKTGLLFDKEDSAALAKQIIFLLEHKEAATQMGLAARKRAEDTFSFERFLDAYEDLYQKLVGSPGAL